MKQTVKPGYQTATINLDGSECEVIFGSRYNVFSVEAENDVVIALESGKKAGDDGTLTCKGGENLTYDHMRMLDRVYLTGSGKVQIIASNNAAVSHFKKAPKGGDSSGGSSDYANALKVYSDTTQGIYADSSKSKRTIEIDAGKSSGYLQLSNSQVSLKERSITDVSSTVEISGADGIKLNGKPLTFGRYRDTDKMILSDNYIQANDALNVSTISSDPASTSKVRIKPSNGGIELSRVVNTYEWSASASGDGSVAVGSTSEASGAGSVAVGIHAKASGNGSVAVGGSSYMGKWYFYTKASGNNSIAVGQGLNAGSSNQAVFGKFNSNETYDLFEVGSGSYAFPNGNYSESRKNALSVDTSGNTTVDKTVVSGGHLILNNSLDIRSSNADVQASITSSIYQIVKHIADLRHMTVTSSTYSNSVFTNPDVNEFGFVLEAYSTAYYVTAKRFPINMRSPSSVKLVFSWFDSNPSAVTEHKCLVEINNQPVADPMTCTVVCSS